MQELQYFYLYIHTYPFCFGTKVTQFFKFTGQTRHFMTRLEVIIVPNNIISIPSNVLQRNNVNLVAKRWFPKWRFRKCEYNGSLNILKYFGRTDMSDDAIISVCLRLKGNPSGVRWQMFIRGAILPRYCRLTQNGNRHATGPCLMARHTIWSIIQQKNELM